MSAAWVFAIAVFVLGCAVAGLGLLRMRGHRKYERTYPGRVWSYIVLGLAGVVSCAVLLNAFGVIPAGPRVGKLAEASGRDVALLMQVTVSYVVSPAIVGALLAVVNDAARFVRHRLLRRFLMAVITAMALFFLTASGLFLSYLVAP